MELPCEKLHCELLARLRKGTSPSEFSKSIEEMENFAHQLAEWFQERDILPTDSLGIMEILKAEVWEALARTN